MDDLERFWSDLLSEDPALIAKAWSLLDVAERDAVDAHLRAMAADPERHPGQRRAARVALSVVAHPPASRLLLASSSLCSSSLSRSLAARLAAPASMISRSSKTSRMSCGLMWETVEPRPGTFSTRPSRSSCRKASRMGVLLTECSRAKSASLIGSPGRNSPSMMRRRRLS